MSWKAARPSLLSVTVFTLATLAVYSHFLSGPYLPKLLAMPDHWKQNGPYAFFMDFSVQRGELPFWNPLRLCGQPLAGHPTVAMFYPPNLVRSLLNSHPTPFRTHVGVAIVAGLHVILAGIGAFFLGRENRLSYGASLVVGLTYAFSASFMRHLTAHWQFTAVAAWLPFILVLVHREFAASSLRAKLNYGLAAGLAFGLSTLAGFPQITIYMAIAIAGYALLHRLMYPKGFDGEHQLGLIRTVAVDLAILALIFAVSGMVAAAILVPGEEFARYSARGAGSTIPAQERLGIPRRELFPSMLVYPGPKRLMYDYRGAGAGILLLALAAVFHRRWKSVLLYAMLFWTLFECALGRPFLTFTLLANYAPIKLDHMDRAVLIAILPLGMLAGFGVDAVAMKCKTRWRSILRSCFLLTGGSCLLFALIKWAPFYSYLPVSKLVILFPAIALCLMLAASWIPLSKLWRAVVPLLIFAEIYAWTHHLVPYWLSFRKFPGSIEALYREPEFPLDNRRGVDTRPNTGIYALEPAINGYDSLYIKAVREHIASPDRAPIFYAYTGAKEVTALNARSHLFLKRFFWLARQYTEGPLPGKDAYFPSVSTVFLHDVDDLPVPRVERSDLSRRCVSEQAERVFLADRAALAERRKTARHRDAHREGFETTLPVVHLNGVHSALGLRYVSDCPATLFARFFDTRGRSAHGKQLILQPTKDEPATVEIPLPDFEQIRATLTIIPTYTQGKTELVEAFLLRDLADEDEHIRILHYRANSVEVEVRDIPGARVLTFVDSYYPGWKAYIDGWPTHIYRANDVFKAVLVPSGTHRVSFVFRPWRVYAGILISVAASLAIIGVLLRNRLVGTAPRKAPDSLRGNV